MACSSCNKSVWGWGGSGGRGHVTYSSVCALSLVLPSYSSVPLLPLVD